MKRKYIAMHESEQGWSTQKEVKKWIDNHAAENDGEATKKSWRIAEVRELKRKKP